MFLLVTWRDPSPSAAGPWTSRSAAPRSSSCCTRQSSSPSPSPTPPGSSAAAHSATWGARFLPRPAKNGNDNAEEKDFPIVDEKKGDAFPRLNGGSSLWAPGDPRSTAASPSWPSSASSESRRSRLWRRAAPCGPAPLGRSPHPAGAARSARTAGETR